MTESPDGQNTLVKGAVVTASGIVEAFTITETSGERANGFPQMVYYEGNLYFAWTALNNGIPTIEMARATRK